MADAAPVHPLRDHATRLLARIHEDHARAWTQFVDEISTAAAAEADRACAAVRDELTLERDILQTQLDAEMAQRRAAVTERDELLREAGRRRAESGARLANTLSEVKSTLDAIAGAGNGPGLIGAVIEGVLKYFSRVLVCDVLADGYLVRCSTGFEPVMPPKARLRVPSECAIARAASAWELAVAVADERSAYFEGLSGAATRYALAVPLTAHNPGAMLYAEDPIDADVDADVARLAVEIIARQVVLRLRVKPLGTSPETSPSPTRRARRVKMREGTSLVIDDATSTVVDMSTLGAQVLSSHPLRPNTSVRVKNPADSDRASCPAHVVWVIVERRDDPAALLYRAGVEFMDIDAALFDRYAKQIMKMPVRES